MARVEVQSSNIEIDNVLSAIEQKALSYKLINTFANVLFNIAAIYAADQLYTYVWRMLTCPC
jgi:hypothetical protein